MVESKSTDFSRYHDFKPTTLMLVAFDGFTLSRYFSSAVMFRRSSMRSAKSKRELVKPPVIRPGNWQGEVLKGYTVSFGQAVQEGPPRQSVEVSYIVTPAIFTAPDAQFAWPGIILIFAPTPIQPKFSGAGLLLCAKRLLSLNLSLKVTRAQLSDILRMLEANRLKELHFTVEEETDGSWPVHSWTVQAKT
jgi:hypothetical protein